METAVISCSEVNDTPMSLLVVGSVAFDSVRTPYGEVEEILGGSATFFSVTASWFTPFRWWRWSGRISAKNNLEFSASVPSILGNRAGSGAHVPLEGRIPRRHGSGHTLDTQLNVFESFTPKIPAAYLEFEYLFLGNIDPGVAAQCSQGAAPLRASGLDTMNYWIQGKLDELAKVLATVDILLINEGEARLLSKQGNLKRAAADSEDGAAHRGDQAWRARRDAVQRGIRLHRSRLPARSGL